MEANETLATIEEIRAEIGTASRGDYPDRLLDELPKLLQVANSESESLQRLALFVKQYARLLAVVHYDARNSQPTSGPLRRLDGDEELDSQTMLAVSNVCHEACKHGKIQLRSTSDGFPTPIVVAPIAAGQRSVGAICALLGPKTSVKPQRVAEVMQLVATRLSEWHAWQIAHRAEREAKTAAALLELLSCLESSENLHDGCQALVTRLQSFLNCQRVAVGVNGASSRHCQLQAISGFQNFDKHAEVATAVEASMDETILRNDILVWPPEEGGQRLPARTLEQVVVKFGADSVLSVPLTDVNENAVGVCLVVNPRPEGLQYTKDFLEASQQQLGTCLHWIQSSRGGPLFRAWRRINVHLSKRRRLVLLAGFLILSTLLAWPRPHKIRCECQLQPIVRRFVSAPYDGTLQKTLVQPGDVVEEGDVLAQMDGREIRLELSALEAERAQARKAWEVSLSKDDIHEAQQAKLEMKRLELKMQLLRQRQQDLQIKSPLRGIVVSGDLKKSEGAPLTVGQSLFEIAPLEAMKVEVAIPEEDIAYVQPGMETRIRLDSLPRQLLSARIGHIVPRAQARDEQYVFIAEAELENAEEMLRPGMNGHATLVGSPRSVAWLLFHKPFESLLMLLGW